MKVNKITLYISVKIYNTIQYNTIEASNIIRYFSPDVFTPSETRNLCEHHVVSEAHSVGGEICIATQQ